MQNISAALSTSADVTIFSFLSPTSPCAHAVKEMVQQFSSANVSAKKKSASHVLALVSQIQDTGRFALAAVEMDLSGMAVSPCTDGFYVTFFDSHHVQTQYFNVEDLALPHTLSSNEIKILALAWILYSHGTSSSMLEAVDDARKAVRS